MGERLFFDLSPALFSSFKIDDGSRLLLKSLAQYGELEKRSRILDLGCGTGVLGLSIAKRFPASRVSLYDRDLLAAEMTRHNAALNNITPEEIGGALMDRIASDPAELVLSNVPAKAGEAVHRAFLADLGRLVAPGGTAAVVIVTPLTDSFRSHIAELGHTIVHEEKSANHLVLHIEPDAGTPRVDADHPLGAAFRRSGSYTLEKRDYRLDSVHGLPEFDTPSYGTICAASVASDIRKPKATVFVNPGQGHLAARLCAAGKVTRIVVTDRDLLQLETTAHNCRLNAEELPIRTVPAPWPDAAVETDTGVLAGVELIVQELAPIPGTTPLALSGRLHGLLPPGGELLIYGRSSDMHTALKEIHGFELIGNRKYRGTRASLLKKR